MLFFFKKKAITIVAKKTMWRGAHFQEIKKIIISQNRQLQIRLSGVPPIMPITRTTRTKKEGQNRHSEIRLSGVPRILPIRGN